VLDLHLLISNIEFVEFIVALVALVVASKLVVGVERVWIKCYCEADEAGLDVRVAVAVRLIPPPLIDLVAHFLVLVVLELPHDRNIAGCVGEGLSRRDVLDLVSQIDSEIVLVFIGGDVEVWAPILILEELPDVTVDVLGGEIVIQLMFPSLVQAIYLF